jgi:hypothetical protein
MAFTPCLQAQQGVSASGKDGTGAGGTINYTIGQIDYLNTSGKGGNLNQGVQHPVLKIIDDSITNITLSPTLSSDFVILDIGKAELKDLKYTIFDERGRLIKSENILDKQTTIPVQLLADAAYLIEIENAFSYIKSFKIIKN